VSCPHAHQQNGSAERKHRHIVEVGLSLLAHASMPLKFWDEAFLTATFLINLLPSKVINNETPVERLLHTSPNYDSLRIFGCACWPNLRPYNKRKLAYRSKRCVFLGYSPLHKGVKCLDVTTGRVYISRDVVFDENVFPFASLHPNAGKRLREETLLLPPQNIACTNGDVSHDDHMPLPIIPIVTNHGQETPPPDDDDESPSDADHSDENLSQNEEETSEHSSQENPTENDELGAESEEDSPATSDLADPEADPASPAAPAARSGQQHTQAGSVPLRVYTRRLGQPSLSRDPPAINASPTAQQHPGHQSPSRAPPQSQSHASARQLRSPPLIGQEPGSRSSADPNAAPVSAGSSVAPSAAVIPAARVQTRLQKGIKTPKIYTDGTIRYGLLAATGEPCSLSDALGNSKWRKAMEEEYDALLQNQT
jgi:hypothetical protein